MKIKYVWLVIAALSAASYVGGASASDAEKDAVKILDVKATKIEGSDARAYTVKVSYTLATAAHGKVMLGFTPTGSRGYKIASDTKVDKGRGEAELKAKFKDGSVVVHVNLSADPHPKSWTPLAHDKISVSNEKG